jgi:hypothetical protein
MGMLIVEKRKGHDIPAGFAEKAGKYGQESYGIVAISGPDGFHSKCAAEQLDGKTVVELQKMLKDKDVLFGFGNDDASDANNLQPFMLLSEGEDDDVEPILFCFISGDYAGCVEEGVDKSPVIQFFQRHLVPKVSMLYRLLDNDVEKVLQALETDISQKELFATCSEISCIGLMSCDGQVSFLTNDEDEGIVKQFPWGRVSDHMGWKDEAAKASTPAPTGIDNMLAAAKPKIPTPKPKLAVSADPAGPARAAAPTAVPVVAPKAATAVKAPDPADGLLITFPIDLTRKQKEEITTALNGGVTPEGYKKLRTMTLKPDYDSTIINKYQVKKWITSIEKVKVEQFAKDLSTPNIPPGTAQTSSKTPIPQPATKSIEDPIVRIPVEPVITAEGKAKLLKIFDANNNELADNPEEIKDIEQKYTSFAAAAKLKGGLDDCDRIKYDRLVQIAEDDATAICVLLNDYRADRLRLKAENLALMEKLTAPKHKVPTPKPRAVM